MVTAMPLSVSVTKAVIVPTRLLIPAEKSAPERLFRGVVVGAYRQVEKRAAEENRGNTNSAQRRKDAAVKEGRLV